MEIVISNNADKPIYEQITSQIKAMIMSEELKSGESIPSMRALAKSLHVSVITVQKAYETLQRDGLNHYRKRKFCICTKQRILPGGTTAYCRGAPADCRRNRQNKSYFTF